MVGRFSALSLHAGFVHVDTAMYCPTSCINVSDQIVLRWVGLRGRESCLLYLNCVLTALWLLVLSASSSRCHRMVCIVWLWHFPVILTYVLLPVYAVKHILAFRIRISEILPWDRKSYLAHAILPRTSSNAIMLNCILAYSGTSGSLYKNKWIDKNSGELENNPFFVWGYDRKIRPSRSPFVSTRQASWCQTAILGTDFSILLYPHTPDRFLYSNNNTFSSRKWKKNASVEDWWRGKCHWNCFHSRIFLSNYITS